MIARLEYGRTTRLRLLSTWLWVLSAVLAATSAYYVTTAIHDNSQGRTAVQLVAQTMGEHVAALAGAKLEVLAGPTFALVTTPPADRRVTADMLAAAQREGMSCHCRDLLPARAFFRFEPWTGGVEVARVAGDTVALSTALLATVARAEMDRQRSRKVPRLHLRADSLLGPSAVIMLAPEIGNRTRDGALYGLVAPARDLIPVLFGPHIGAAAHTPTGLSLVHLDTMSLHVATSDSGIMFGTLAEDKPYRATVNGQGVLEGMAVTVALQRRQVSLPSLALMPHERLFRIGILLHATLLVVIIAVIVSRREILLARARSDFVAGVSHDLRMPLAQILLAGETLALDRAKDDTERHTLSTSIVREARRLSALVDNVLFFSRAGAVTPRPNFQRVAIGALFHEVVEAVALAVKDAGQTIEVAADDTLAVRADPTMLRQALVNLVDNALKYGAEGQRLRLAARRHASDRVHITVDDQGPGIPEAERARVFGAYERLAHDQTSERTGTGLGLAVVRQIVRACDGKVWIEGAEGGGTRVVIELRASDGA